MDFAIGDIVQMKKKLLVKGHLNVLEVMRTV